MFLNKKNLIKHFKSQISSLPINNKSIKENKRDVRKHTCLFCHKNFEHRSSMLRHQKRHNTLPKSCVHCTFKSTDPRNLSQHMEKKHSHLKEYNCDKCHKTFFKKSNLQRHLQVHEGVKRHICEICGKFR